MSAEQPQPTLADSALPFQLDLPAVGVALRLEGELGRGGMGVIYRAIDPEFGRPVAVKVIAPELATSNSAVRRFLDEAQITGRLQHPGVPPVHRLGTLPDGRPFLAMKLIEGRTFAALLAERGDLGQLLGVFAQVCQTVAYAHAQGVIHRDLKPSNVMVGAFGEVQVMDWGLAKVIAPASEPGAVTVSPIETSVPGSDRPETVAGNALGTPAYMPPEQASGEHHRVTARADVFALGAILCEILTGQPPYSGRYALLAARACDLADVQPLLAACGADADLVALARRCLAADPAERPADGAVVAEALAAYQHGVEQRLRTAEQERAAAVARSVEERKRWRVQRFLTGAVLLLLCAGGAFAWYADRQAREQTARISSARRGMTAALDQAEGLLRADKPDDAARTLDEVAEQLRTNAAADESGDLTARLGGVREQLRLLVELDQVRDRLFTFSSGRFFDEKAAQGAFARVFQGHGLTTAQPAAVAARIEGWAIRDQVLGGLNLWLAVEPAHPDLVALLAHLDPDTPRTAWRAAVAAQNADQQATSAEQLLQGEHPPRFVAAYAVWFPRAVGLRLLRAAWGRHSNSFPLAFAVGTVLRAGSPAEQAEAAGYFRACLGLRPRHSTALNNLGVILVGLGDLDEATARFTDASVSDPHNALARSNLGNALLKRHDLPGAIARFDEALACDNTLPDAHTNRAAALLLSDDPDGAIAACHAALALEPRFAPAHYNLGVILHALGERAEASACWRKAVECDPTYAQAHLNLGNVLLESKDARGAIRHYRQALASLPDDALLHNNLGNALKATGNLDAAIQSYQQSLTLAPRFALAHYGLGMALHVQGKNADEAARCFRQALALDPTHAPSHNGLGLVLQGKGDLPGATRHFEQAVAHAPGFAEAWNNLGKVCFARKELPGAVRAYRQSLAVQPNDPLVHAAVGLLELELGRFDEASAALTRSHTLSGKPPVFLSPVARSLQEVQRWRDLDQRLPRLLEGAETPASAREYLEFAELCWRFRQRPAEAVDLYAEAFRLDPALAANLTAYYRYNAACVAVRAGQRQQAHDWLRADLTAWLPKRNRAQELGLWLTDTDLAPVRDPDALARLPDEERRTWEQLWAEVRRAVAGGAP